MTNTQHTHQHTTRQSQLALPSKLAVVGKGIIKNNALLSATLQAEIQRCYPITSIIPMVSNQKRRDRLPAGFIGWGHKKSFQRAKKLAKKQGVPVFSLEDGFLRSLDAGINSRHAVSLVVDDIGIYFDLTQPSRLEQMIVQRMDTGTSITDSARKDNWSDKHFEVAHRLIDKIVVNRLSKYNDNIEAVELAQLANVEKSTSPVLSHVLLIDQVAGDASIAGAGADKSQFKKMLTDACNNHPTAQIWIKAHPAGKKGYLTELSIPRKDKHRVRIIADKSNPIALLEQVTDVYTVSSHMGFEALMLGKQVHCYGVNWYSGWGLTNDNHAPQKLLKKVHARRASLLKNCPNSQTIMATVEQLFYAAYMDYSRYADPATSSACDIDTAMNWLITNRYWHNKLKGELTVYEFSRWKVPFIESFVNFPSVELRVKKKPLLKAFDKTNTIDNIQSPVVAWGLSKQLALKNILGKTSPVYCIEDGFIRSNGLGAALFTPLSIVLDKSGIYYNATQASDLEKLINNCIKLNDEQAQRVESLHEYMLSQKVSKYNVGKRLHDKKGSLLKQLSAVNQNKILIVGQVEGDLSIKYCGSAISNNTDLIKRVRTDNPNAYLVYKPHPDVESGLRKGKVDKKTLKLANMVAHDVAMPDCLELVDEVHTISSLTGFEALLRGKSVSCYGLPFYAGWGLTHDIDADNAPKRDYIQRRHRSSPLTLEQLIYCTLIEYPMYRLPDGYGLAQVEQVIDYLYEQEASKTTQKKSAIVYAKTKLMQARNIVNRT